VGSRRLEFDRLQRLLRVRHSLFKHKQAAWKKKEAQRVQEELLKNPLSLWKRKKKAVSSAGGASRPSSRTFSNNWVGVFEDSNEEPLPSVHPLAPSPFHPSVLPFSFHQISSHLKKMNKKKAASLESIPPAQLDLCFAKSALSRFLFFVLFNLMHNIHACWPPL